MPSTDVDVTVLERRTPSQARSRARRERILDAARALVEEAQTVEGITTRHIADRAGVPIGSIYYLFPNLQAVYHALFSTELSRARAAAQDDRVSKNATWQQRIDATVDGMMHFFWDTPLVSMLWRSMRADAELRELNDADNVRWEAANEKLLARALPHVSEGRRRMMACVMVRISECILSESLSTQDADRRAKLSDELKRNLHAYVSANIPPEVDA